MRNSCRLIGVASVFVLAVSMFGLPAAVASHESMLSAGSRQAQFRKPAGVSETTYGEKKRAVEQVQIAHPPEAWYELTDRNFVAALWKVLEPERWPLTRDAATEAVMGTDEDCTAFIRTGIHEKARADLANWVAGEKERLRENNAKRSAAVLLKIEPTDALLRLNLHSFVLEIRRVASGSHVREAASRSLEIGTRAALLEFLEVKIIEAHNKDSAAADQAERMRRAKVAAAALFSIDGEQYKNTPDRDFILKVVEWSTKKRPRVHDAAVIALGSSDPEVWRKFILIGIHDANNQDLEDEQAKQEEITRSEVRKIIVRAEQSRLRPALVKAGEAALKGTFNEVTKFLREGQYDHLEQSLEGYYGELADNTTDKIYEQRLYIRGEPGPAELSFGDDGSVRKTLTFATWRVIDGLAGDGCYSFESSDRKGYFLWAGNDGKVSIAGNNGSASFKQQATWCSRLGNRGEGVSLEQFANPGKFLTRYRGEVWSMVKTNQLYYHYDAYTTFHPASPRPNITTPIAYIEVMASKIGLFGAPIDEEKLEDGVRFRDFERMRVYTNGKMDLTKHNLLGWYLNGRYALVDRGPILDKFIALGDHRFGFPGGVDKCDDGRGQKMVFPTGDRAIYYTPTTGAHLVLGAIGKHWESLGGIKSYLGYPTSDEVRVGNIAKSQFEHGHIEFNFDTGEVKDVRG